MEGLQMAIYHFSAQSIGRSKGKCATASAAYRSGEKIYDERLNITYDFTKKSDVVFKEIFLPESAPESFENRAILWNEVEKVEKRKDSVLAREINIALPVEIDREQQENLIREYVKDNFVSKGMIADVSIHDKGNGNPHAHVMLTTRSVSPEGFGKKNTEWEPTFRNGKAIKTDLIEEWREKWSEYANKALEQVHSKERIDHRSYERQESEMLPTKHMGASVHQLEKRGIKTRIGELNKEIKEFNSRQIVVLKEYRWLKEQLKIEEEKLKKVKPVKRYKIKEMPDEMQIKRQYFPENTKVDKKHIKAIKILKNSFGALQTVEFLYMVFYILQKQVEENLKLVEEIKDNYERMKKLIEKKGEIEKEKGILARIKNRRQLNDVRNGIEVYKEKLNLKEIRNEADYSQKIAEFDSRVQTYKRAEKAIEDLKDNKYCDKYRKKSVEETLRQVRERKQEQFVIIAKDHANTRKNERHISRGR